MSPWLGWWLGHPTQGLPSALLRNGALFMCIENRCSSVSPCSAPDLTVLPWSAGWLCSPPGLLQQTKIYSPFYFWEMGRQGGNFIQAFLPQSSFEKQQSQKRMRRNKQYTFLELRHPDRDRQAGRPSPTHRLHNPIAALIVSLFVSHPQDGWGCGKRWETAP